MGLRKLWSFFIQSLCLMSTVKKEAVDMSGCLHKDLGDRKELFPYIFSDLKFRTWVTGLDRLMSCLLVEFRHLLK